jgi:hypothetical protein
VRRLIIETDVLECVFPPHVSVQRMFAAVLRATGVPGA